MNKTLIMDQLNEMEGIESIDDSEQSLDNRMIEALREEGLLTAAENLKSKIELKKKLLTAYEFYRFVSEETMKKFQEALRERTKCSVRKAKTFAKKRQTIKDLLFIYQAYHNLIDARYGKTPCMKEGLTDFIWNWGKLLNVKIGVEM